MSGVGASFGSDDRDMVLGKCMDSIAAKVLPYLGSKKFLEGNDVSLNDFTLFEYCDMINALTEGDDRLFTANPTLKAHRENMLAIPKFAAYYNSDACVKRPILAPFCKLPQWSQ